MSIFDYMRQERTDRRFVSPFDMPSLTVYESITPTKAPQQPFWRDEFALRLEVVQTFWANPAQMDDARKEALNACAANLFSDIHRELAILNNAIYSGCAEQAIECVARIRKVITP